MSAHFAALRQASKKQELVHAPSELVVAGDKTRQKNPSAQSQEEIVKLVRRLFSSGVQGPRVVLFAAVEHGSGCSSICGRAAEVLSAHVDSPVCLVDADFRSPALHKHCEVDEARGVSLQRLPSAVPIRSFDGRATPSNLWLLSQKPQTLLSFDYLQSQISELRNHGAYVLIDSPPINAYADSVLLARMADGLVMVIEANHTRREAAIRAKRSLHSAGVPLLGVVLNRRTFPIPEKLYRKL